MIRWIALVLGLALATPGSSEEAGTFAGALDGEDVILELMASQSDHRGDANFGSVSMVFSAGGVAGINMIFVGFEIHDGTAAVPDIRMVAKDRSMYFPREDEDFIIEIDEASKSGELITIKGRLSFMADLSNDFGRTLDSSSNHQLEGTFEVAIGPV